MYAGRLEDKSSIVRKAALQLLAALLLYNPFGGELPEGRFEASLTEWKAKLQVTSNQPPILSHGCWNQAPIRGFPCALQTPVQKRAERAKSCAAGGQLAVDATSGPNGFSC